MMIIDGGRRLLRRAAAGGDGKLTVARVGLGRQVGIVAAAVTAYFLVRGMTEAAVGEAMRNAYLLVDLERALGLYHEPALQAALAGSSTVRTLLNGIYIYGHWPVIAVALLWLARRHPAIYLRTRNAMLLSGAVGLVVFVSFPVAPPRLAGLGMVDTVTLGSSAYRVLQPAMFTNQYAAMPSLHVGWDLLIGLAVAAASRRFLLRIVAVIMPAAMVVTVVLTANHYIVDAVAGVGLAVSCWVAVVSRPRARVRRSVSHGAPTAMFPSVSGRRPVPIQREGSPAAVRGVGAGN